MGFYEIKQSIMFALGVIIAVAVMIVVMTASSTRNEVSATTSEVTQVVEKGTDSLSTDQPQANGKLALESQSQSLERDCEKDLNVVEVITMNTESGCGAIGRTEVTKAVKAPNVSTTTTSSTTTPSVTNKVVHKRLHFADKMVRKVCGAPDTGWNKNWPHHKKHQVSSVDRLMQNIQKYCTSKEEIALVAEQWRALMVVPYYDEDEDPLNVGYHSPPTKTARMSSSNCNGMQLAHPSCKS